MMQHPCALLLQHVTHRTQCDEMSGVRAIFIAKFKHWLAARGLPLKHNHNNDVTEYQHSFGCNSECKSLWGEPERVHRNIKQNIQATETTYAQHN